MQKRKIDLMIFDLDGTLIDSRKDIVDSTNYIRTKENLPPLPFEIIVRFVGDGAEKLVRRAVPELNESRLAICVKEFRDHYREHCLDTTVLYNGVLETLLFFEDKIKTVLSNKPHDMAIKILKGLGVYELFRLVVGADAMPKLKPDPSGFIDILENFRVDPSRAVMIGDGLADIAGGKNAKIFTCAVTYGLYDRKTVETYSSDYIIESPIELKNIFF